MRHRVVKAFIALAACLPATALAQQAPMGTSHAGSWELSVGAGATYLDQELTAVVRVTDQTQRLVPGVVVRLGYNLGASWNLSVGTFAGYTSPMTVLQPFGAVSWTPNIDAKFSPFVMLGGGATNVAWRSYKTTSQYGVHVGAGVRYMLGQRMALRVEVREQMEAFKDTTSPKVVFPNSVFNTTATVGLSFFFGGRSAPAPAVAEAPAPVQAAPAPAQAAPAPAQAAPTPAEAAPTPAPAVPTPAPAAAPAAQPGWSLGIAPTADTLVALGQTQQLSAVAQDPNNNVITSPQVTWTSSDPTVASVSASGLVTSIKNGTATITAAGPGGTSAVATFLVHQIVATVTVTPPTATISSAGGTAQFTAQANDPNGRPVTGKVIAWADSAPSVATVGRGGVVTAVANGTTTISATVEGVTGSATLTVNLSAAPAAVVVALPAVGAAPEILKSVNFRPNSAVLPAESFDELDATARAIQATPNSRWEIGGYTSSMGNEARNQLLSRRRALAVRAYLIRQGVPAARLTAVGYGPNNPIASNATAAGRRQNMRVELKRLR